MSIEYWIDFEIFISEKRIYVWRFNNFIKKKVPIEKKKILKISSFHRVVRSFLWEILTFAWFWVVISEQLFNFYQEVLQYTVGNNVKINF